MQIPSTNLNNNMMKVFKKNIIYDLKMETIKTNVQKYSKKQNTFIIFVQLLLILKCKNDNH